jgi:MFS transporter, ACS family, D-galactonate transporter
MIDQRPGAGTESLATPPVVTRRLQGRHVVLGLMFVGMIISYIDRTNISVVGPTLAKELNIGPAGLGLIFSAFAWTYAIGNPPGGFLVDRYGTRRTLGIALLAWSTVTVLQAAAAGFASFMALRLALGAAEAPVAPSYNRAAATWFPTRERALAISIYTSGQYVGLGLLTPVMFFLNANFGWQSVFLATGAVGLIWAVVWWSFYQDPAQSRFANTAERTHIRVSGALEPGAPAGGFQWRQMLDLLRYRQTWGVCIGKFASTSPLWFATTWYPTYLLTERHMSVMKAGFSAAIPYAAATVGIIFGGWWSDAMLRRGVAPGTARKLPIVLGLLLTCSIVVANFTDSSVLVVAVLSLVLFAQGMSNVSWALVADIAPPSHVATLGGIFNLAGSLAGSVVPLVVGLILAATGSFVGGLAFVGLMGLLGALSYIFVVGPVRRIELT